MDIIYLVAGVAWIICATVSYGLTFAYFQRKYPMIASDVYKHDMCVCLFLSLLGGPTGIVFVVLRSGFKYGMKFW